MELRILEFAAECQVVLKGFDLPNGLVLVVITETSEPNPIDRSSDGNFATWIAIRCSTFQFAVVGSSDNLIRGLNKLLEVFNVVCVEEQVVLEGAYCVRVKPKPRVPGSLQIMADGRIRLKAGTLVW